MKRIGLFIFGLIAMGLYLNIALLENFGLELSSTKLLLTQVILNVVILGIAINYMINKLAFISHIAITIFLYSFILGSYTLNFNFAETIQNQDDIDIVARVRDVNFYDKYEYTLSISSINNNDLRVNKKVLIKSYSDCDLEIGDIVKANISIEESENKYVFSRRVLAFGKFNDYEIIGHKFSILKYSKMAQEKIIGIIDESLGGYYAEVISSFLIGEKLLNVGIKNTLIATGIYHFMAISGLHVGLIFSISKWIYDRLFSRPTAIKLTMVTIIIYAFITGMSFSTTRAMLMMLIVLWGNLNNVKSDSLNAVGVAGVTILCFSPFALYNIGFIYSFTIILGIMISNNTVIYLLKTLVGLRYDTEYSFINYTATIITAQLYFIPIGSYLFGSLYIYSFFVNMLTVFLVPLLFTSSLFMVVFYGTFINTILSELIKFLIDYILMLSKWFEKLPSSTIYVGEPNIIIMLLCYGVLVGVSYYATKNIYEVNYGKFSKKPIFIEE